MPLTETETSRIADAIAAIRPDWPARSLRAFVANKLRDRTYADALVALVVVAADPTTDTPARVLEHGPWWTATRTNHTTTTFTPGPGRSAACQRPGHEHEQANACRACRAEALAGHEHEQPPPALPAPPRPTPRKPQATTSATEPRT